MNTFLMRMADLMGLFGKARTWLQGKKTYAVNILQALAGIGAMLALTGQVLDLASKSLSILMGWADSGQTGDAAASIKALWSNHAVLAAGFSAAFYSVTDAVSKMTAYAAEQRRAAQACDKAVLPASKP